VTEVSEPIASLTTELAAIPGIGMLHIEAQRYRPIGAPAGTFESADKVYVRFDPAGLSA
jgi:hypothetical protein